MLLSTQDPNSHSKTNHLYKFIIEGIRKNTEKNYKNTDIKIKVFKNLKILSISYVFFLIYIIFSGKIFSNNRAKIKFRNTEVGRFVVAQTFQNFKTYLSLFQFYKVLLKNFVKAGIMINTADYFYSNENIKAIYIDHCGGLNGILYSYFSSKNIIIYTNMYPANIYGVDFRYKKKLNLINFEDSIKINKKFILNKQQKKKTKNLLKKLFVKPNYLEWMSQTKYKKRNEAINYDQFDYVVYAHSFTDDQLCYGFDGFENTLDWLNFTLNKLDNLGKRVLIKAHPNFYSTSLGILSTWDKKIFSKNKKQFLDKKNFYFIDKPIFNYDLLKHVNKSAILISHHGTVLLEGAQLGFKSICSKATMFNKKFKVSNYWSDKTEYERLLSQKYENLKLPNKDDLEFLVYKMFASDHSYSGKYFWQNVIAKEIGIKSMIEWNKKIEIFGNSRDIDKRIRFFKKLVKGKESIIAKKISKNIELL